MSSNRSSAYDLTTHQCFIDGNVIEDWWFTEMVGRFTKAAPEVALLIDRRFNLGGSLEVSDIEDYYVFIGDVACTRASVVEVARQHYADTAASSESDETDEDGSMPLQADATVTVEVALSRRRPSARLVIVYTLGSIGCILAGIALTALPAIAWMALSRPTETVHFNRGLTFFIAYGLFAVSIGVAFLRSGVDLNEKSSLTWFWPRVIVNLVVWVIGAQVALCILGLWVSLTLLK